MPIVSASMLVRMNLYDCIWTHLYEPITAEMLCAFTHISHFYELQIWSACHLYTFYLPLHAIAVMGSSYEFVCISVCVRTLNVSRYNRPSVRQTGVSYGKEATLLMPF